MKPKIALFAYSEPGYACFEELLKLKANIKVVFTHLDSDDEEIWFHSVYKLAKKHNILVYRSNKVDDKAREIFNNVSPELIISSYYRAIIPDDFLNSVKGAFNFHGSLLPKYRGRAPINWVVLKGEKETGVTLHEMTKLADRGDIIDQIAFPIEENETAHDVFLKVSLAVKKLTRKNLPSLESGNYFHFPQDETKATKFGKRSPQDGKINWQDDNNGVYNLIRAVTHPFPGAFSHLEDKKIFIWKAKKEKEIKEMEKLNIGEIYRLNGNVLVKCKQGIIKLINVQVEGLPEMMAKDCHLFQNGKCFQ